MYEDNDSEGMTIIFSNIYVPANWKSEFQNLAYKHENLTYHCTSVVRCGNCTKPLLTGCVPEIHRNLYIVHRNLYIVHVVDRNLYIVHVVHRFLYIVHVINITKGEMDRQTNRRTNDPIPRCPQRTFQARGIKIKSTKCFMCVHVHMTLMPVILHLDWSISYTSSVM